MRTSSCVSQKTQTEVAGSDGSILTYETGNIYWHHTLYISPSTVGCDGIFGFGYQHWWNTFRPRSWRQHSPPKFRHIHLRNYRRPQPEPTILHTRTPL